ncbi:NAD(P)-dependent dehydrogenase (short-subunit alcohol dehydrogenase family) [Halorubrum trapanicum]|uniref:NAD(P)-dependent dehydrogenase (Short-subunit alcohol dehydrogenase family) n=1 Tax=Halorubrum trapanicum TaxID=29284 RepID=A0A8J7R5E0_9EURY|nr:NAD(P)-dependent dehydrogenase (short-subunit alcohol dehydrogenase family) [Halorubrum trapanicum]
MSRADLSIAVTGAGGRMGREVIEAAAGREGVAVAVAVNRTPTDPVAGVAGLYAPTSPNCSRTRSRTPSSTSPGRPRRSRTPRPAPTPASRS